MALGVSLGDGWSAGSAKRLQIIALRGLINSPMGLTYYLAGGIYYTLGDYTLTTGGTILLFLMFACSAICVTKC